MTTAMTSPTINRRHLAAGAVLSIFGAVALGVWIDVSSRDSREAAESIYQNVRELIGQTVATGQMRLEQVVADPMALSEVDGECGRPLADAMQQFGDDHDVFLRIRPNGTLDCTPAGASKPVDLSERLYFKKAMDLKRPVVGEFLVGKVSNEPVLAVATPVFDDAGAVKFVFVTGLKLSWLKGVIDSAAQDHGLIIELQDSNGVPLSYFQDQSVARTFGKAAKAELMRLPLLPESSDTQIVILEQL